jgi:lactoylglutathione lyase
MIQATEHFSFTVSSMDAALHFFRDLLGLEAGPVAEVENKDVQKIVGLPGAVMRVSLLQAPDGINIELIEYVEPQGCKIDAAVYNPGAAHIAFQVDNIEQTFMDLSEKGVRFVNPPVWTLGNDGKGQWGVAYLKGPDGITVELVEKKA